MKEHQGAGQLLARAVTESLPPGASLLVLIPDRGNTSSAVADGIRDSFVREMRKAKVDFHSHPVPYGREKQMQGFFAGLTQDDLGNALSVMPRPPAAVVSLLGPPQPGVYLGNKMLIFSICTTEQQARSALEDERLDVAIVDVRAPGADPRIRNYQILR